MARSFSVGGQASAVDLSHALVWQHRVIEATAKAEIQVDHSTHMLVLALINADIDQLKPPPHHGLRPHLTHL